jgi:hypothetical protein
MRNLLLIVFVYDDLDFIDFFYTISNLLFIFV